MIQIRRQYYNMTSWYTKGWYEMYGFVEVGVVISTNWQTDVEFLRQSPSQSQICSSRLLQSFDSPQKKQLIDLIMGLAKD